MQEQKKYNLADGNIRKRFVTYKQAAELYSIGWSVRDYSKTNQDWVRNFVETHKDKMDKLSIREASKYL